MFFRFDLSSKLPRSMRAVIAAFLILTATSASIASAKTWNDPVLMQENITLDGTSVTDLPGPGHNPRPVVAMNRWGDTVIAWVQYTSTPGHRHIFMSERRNGSWHHPASFNDHLDFKLPDGSPDSSSPAVAIDDSGNTIITWTQSDGSNIQLFKAEYRNYNGQWQWRKPVSLSDNISPDGFDVIDVMSGYTNPPGSVAMNNRGYSLITWSQRTPNGSTKIFKSEYRSGIWGIPNGINDNINLLNTENVQSQALVADNGDAVITWLGTDSFGVKYQVLKSERRAATGGIWQHPLNANDSISLHRTSVHTFKPIRAAMNNHGDTIIPWIQTGAGFSGTVFASIYRNGAWTHPTSYLSSPISPLARNVDAQSAFAAINNLGDFVVTWVSDDQTHSLQLFRAWEINGVWHAPINTNDYISIGASPVDPLTDCNVGIDDNGEAVITWSQFDAASAKQLVFRSSYRQGVWEPITSYSQAFGPTASSYFDRPVVAVGANGDAAITYVGNYLGNIQLYLSEYR